MHWADGVSCSSLSMEDRAGLRTRVAFRKIRAARWVMRIRRRRACWWFLRARRWKSSSWETQTRLRCCGAGTTASSRLPISPPGSRSCCRTCQTRTWNIRIADAYSSKPHSQDAEACCFTARSARMCTLPRLIPCRLPIGCGWTRKSESMWTCTAFFCRRTLTRSFKTASSR